MNINPQTIQFYVQLFEAIQAGAITVVNGFKGLLHILHPQATDAELDAAVDQVAADAARRKAERDQMGGAQ